MKTVVLYPYDPELRPGVVGADFVDEENSNHDFTLRREIEEMADLMDDITKWLSE